MKPFLRLKPRNAGIGSNGIDITPLMDIVFQLLLFFILTSAMLQPSLSLDLPGSSRDHGQTEAETVVSVDGNGGVFLNETPVSMEIIESTLRSLAGEKPDAAVILRGDRLVQYGRFFAVLEIIRSAGIRTVNLAYEEEER
jgi:biopolymer transport protein ExbD